MNNQESMLDRSNRAVLEKAKAVRSSAYALKYHIAAPSGWINDPNGLMRFGGRYHVFYQHYPYEPVWGPMHWGHASSADLAHWRHEPIALAPDMPYETGCFSGSAVDDDGVFTLIYTAHNDNSPIKETQCIARSFDGGRTFVKSAANPVIPMYPEDCSADFRDPKVWKQDSKWQMVVGTSRNGLGCAALYSAEDMDNWTYRGIMCESDGTLGSMWECPNFCRPDGQDMLIISPMEMPGHKNIALFGKFDCASGKMAIDHWQEIDLGEDFYAAQVFDDGDRTILIGWMDMWGKQHPTEKDGWAGALTIPRELHVHSGKLLQKPVPELSALRDVCLVSKGSAESLSEISGDALELQIGMQHGQLTFSDSEGALLSIRTEEEKITFTLPDKEVSAPLTLPCSAPGLHIYIDRCSVECFANDGEVCFSQRIYPRGDLSLNLEGSAAVSAWTLSDAFAEETC